jgi:hypothetical protein
MQILQFLAMSRGQANWLEWSGVFGANLQLSWLVSEKVPLLEFVLLFAVDPDLQTFKGTVSRD